MWAIEGVADFNGDGRPDLAVARFFTNTVSVLLNTTVPGEASASFAVPMRELSREGARLTVAREGKGRFDIKVVVAQVFHQGRADFAFDGAGLAGAVGDVNHGHERSSMPLDNGK